jgi:metal-dependent amidase/aminoacylase/carboxypeptidase family protein
MHHNQKFDFDEECLSLGVQLMLSLVDEKLN